MSPINPFRMILTAPELGRVFEIPHDRVVIGRQPGSDVLLENSQVSRSHALIERQEGDAWLSDLGSSNGTYLNGERLARDVPVKLADDDVIKIGPYQLTFQLQVLTEGSGAAWEETQKPLEGMVSPLESPSELHEDQVGIFIPEGPGQGTPLPPGVPPSFTFPEQAPIMPPGLSIYSQRLINFLPGIYQTEFMSRFLGLFESILLPVDWTIDNFDLYLDAGTSPAGFLPWLARWFEITFDSNWTECRTRDLLKEAYAIYTRRGTAWAMRRVLEIYTGCEVEVIDKGEDLKPFEFRVRLHANEREVKRPLAEALIEAHKPVHTHYILEFVH